MSASDATTGDETAAVDVEAIRARAAAATPGPWVWRGNMDHEDPRLVGRNRIGEDGKRKFPGMIEVLWSYLRERQPTDAEADRYREFLHDTQFEDDQGGFRALTDDEVEERVRDEWLTDRWGEPASERRLCFTSPQAFALDARDLAVFEVGRARGLPDDTPRSDRRIYRADIIGVRHPDAEFIAHARQDVEDLLAALTTAQAEGYRQAIDDAAAAVGARRKNPLIALGDATFNEGLDHAIAAIRSLSPEGASDRVCESGCGCRYGTDDPDSRDCGCDGPCTTTGPDEWGCLGRPDASCGGDCPKCPSPEGDRTDAVD